MGKSWGEEGPRLPFIAPFLLGVAYFPKDSLLDFPIQDVTFQCQLWGECFIVFMEGITAYSPLIPSTPEIILCRREFIPLYFIGGNGCLGHVEEETKE